MQTPPPPLKVEVLSSPTLFENLVGGSTPCTKRGAHYWGVLEKNHWMVEGRGEGAKVNNA